MLILPSSLPVVGSRVFACLQIETSVNVLLCTTRLLHKVSPGSTGRTYMVVRVAGVVWATRMCMFWGAAAITKVTTVGKLVTITIGSCHEDHKHGRRKNKHSAVVKWTWSPKTVMSERTKAYKRIWGKVVGS